MRPGDRDLGDFLDQVVLPALFNRLDTAFPEFGWKRGGSGWTATNRDYTKKITRARAERVVCNRPFGFLVHGGEATSWLSYINDGVNPTGPAFLQKVKELAALAGVPVPERELSKEDLQRQDENNKRRKLLEDFAAVTHAALVGDGGEPARAYLKGRHLLDSVEAFGYYPTRDEVLSALVARGHTREELEAANLTEEVYRFWEGRLVIPWRDRWDGPGTFAARDLTGEAERKYLYMAGREKPLLFGLHHALGTKEGRDHLVIVEGLPDVVHLQALGFSNVAAIGGDGKNMTPAKWEALAAEGVSSVTLALDNDPKEDGTWPGREGTRKAVENVRKVRNGGKVPVVYVLDPALLGPPRDPKDPDELVRKQSLDAFRAVLEKKVNAHRFMAEDLVREHKPADKWTDEALSRLLDGAKRYDASVPPEEGLELGTFFWPTIASETGISPENVEAVRRELQATRERRSVEEEKRRSLQAAADTVSSLLKDGKTEKAASVMRDAADTLRVRDRRAAVDPVLSVAEELDAHRAHLEKWRGVDFLGLPQKTLPTLDEYTSGLRGLMLLAARPGVGKTVLGVQFGVDVVCNNPDTSFLFVSAEMLRGDIITRTLSRLSGLTWRTYVYGDERLNREGTGERFTSYQAQAIAAAEDQVRKWGNRVRILDVKNFPEPTVGGVLAHLRDLKEKTGTSRSFLLVAYLQVWPIPEDKERGVRSDLDADKYRIGAMKDLRDGAAAEDAILVISEARKPQGGKTGEWGGDLEDVMGSARGTYTPDMVFLFQPFTDSERKKAGIEDADMTREGKQGQRRAYNKLTIAKGRDGVRRGSLDLTFFYDLSTFKEGVVKEAEP